MRPLPRFAWGWALALLAAGGSPASAAWNNVFQVCCNHCGKSTPAPVVAGYAGDPCGCPAPCPQTTCTTQYVQRSYYQPVTSYRTSYYYEPVTSYRTSYYYEPVCSYRYSCYYDPCTCSYQSVAQPVTSYRLRSRCCPVTSYLQRTCMTPVTTYQQSFYYEPVTTCCTTSTGAAVTTPPAGATIAPATPAPAAAPPATSESRDAMPPPPPGTVESRDNGATLSERYRPRTPDLTPPSKMPGTENRYRAPSARPPVTRFDRIASRSGGYNLQGKVVEPGRRPLANARVLLVSVDAKSNQHTLTADRDGQFQARVSAGGWLVYTYDDRGRPIFSRRIEVPSERSVTMTLTRR